MPKIKIIEDSTIMRIFFPKWAYGFTLGKTIRLKGKLENHYEWLIWHEVCHVFQYQKYGILKFLWTYFVLEMHIPYREKKFEVEAYKIRDREDLLKMWPEHADVIAEVRAKYFPVRLETGEPDETDEQPVQIA